MKNVYLFTVNFINLLLVGAVCFLGLAMFTNISEPDSIPTFNPIDVGLLIFLFFIWLISYSYQIKNRKWTVLLIANLLYIAITLFLLMIIVPFLFDIFYY
ncbi:hypothetical protein [Ornithinibacillus contaminans]|uniref:hypothetical protein n=1 Tax=Ornithinibacillus contaminans TaxID=694055 RepID=UPI00064DDA17|nr:hypothetical protein [Ornithinibacillus contaminans]